MVTVKPAPCQLTAGRRWMPLGRSGTRPACKTRLSAKRRIKPTPLGAGSRGLSEPVARRALRGLTEGVGDPGSRSRSANGITALKRSSERYRPPTWLGAAAVAAKPPAAVKPPEGDSRTTPPAPATPRPALRIGVTATRVLTPGWLRSLRGPAVSARRMRPKMRRIASRSPVNPNGAEPSVVTVPMRPLSGNSRGPLWTAVNPMGPTPLIGTLNVSIDLGLLVLGGALRHVRNQALGSLRLSVAATCGLPRQPAP